MFGGHVRHKNKPLTNLHRSPMLIYEFEFEAKILLRFRFCDDVLRSFVEASERPAINFGRKKTEPLELTRILGSSGSARKYFT